jgi:hypothetical protein
LLQGVPQRPNTPFPPDAPAPPPGRSIVLTFSSLTLALEPEARALFDQVLESDLFTADERPKPTDEERKPPKTGADDEMVQSTMLDDE